MRARQNFQYWLIERPKPTPCKYQQATLFRAFHRIHEVKINCQTHRLIIDFYNNSMVKPFNYCSDYDFVTNFFLHMQCLSMGIGHTIALFRQNVHGIAWLQPGSWRQIDCWLQKHKAFLRPS